MSAESCVIPVEGHPHTLQGRLRRPAGAPLALIAPPHPLYGGTIGSPVVRALEAAFQERGVGTLAFNFRGTGESGGEPSGAAADALVDYRAAARSVSDAKPAWLSGYSFGGVAALAAAAELGVPRVLMVAPPLGMLRPQQVLLERYAGGLAVVVGSDDEYAPADGLRALLAGRPHTHLEVVHEAEHFFVGSAVARLSAALAALLERASA